MLGLVEKIASRGHATREDVRREVSRQPKPRSIGRPKPFTFHYKAPTKAFSFQLKFRKGSVEKLEIIETLEHILDELRQAH
jgi:hypothetical protein